MSNVKYMREPYKAIDWLYNQLCSLLSRITNIESNNTDSTKLVNTYADMLELVPKSYVINVKVLNDENKGQTNTRYEIWPDGVIEWIAAVVNNA